MIRWTNVRLIFLREVRDQLRDRRTLFMIFVLPLLMYPLLGMSFFQMAQFVQRHATQVLLIGSEQLPETPRLLEESHFVADEDRLLDVTLDATPAAATADEALERARGLVTQGEYEAVVYFPPDFGAQLEQFRQAITSVGAAPEAPRPRIVFNTAKEKSQLTYARIEQVLQRWSQELRDQNLTALGVDPTIVRTIRPQQIDVADAVHRDAALWSKIFPFLLLIWSLTGAFYPAVDLCAGEKERGTLETLLSSPAERDEIVWGKLLTVMTFSVATVLFNLGSVGLTGTLALRHLPQFGPPPASSLLWLVAALLPVSALFSALCLALAAFARSSKEGQYYLMPLVIITLPLVMLPMSPGVELTLGNSLIPLTGVVLLLRSMIEGDYWHALPYVVPVTAVTLACCFVAIRWAIDQFNKESVLFRESERLDLRLWLWHLYRDREETPTAAAAACGVALILLARFFLGFVLPAPQEVGGLLGVALATQVFVILVPALLLTWLLARSPIKTLLLRAPSWPAVAAAALLALCLHPSALWLQHGVMKLYPLDERLVEQLNGLFQGEMNLALMLLVMAVTPAICEELAFRGFVLSGLRHLGSKWQAIVLSSLAFGMTHAIFQQSLVASLVGCVIGFIAVQTGSIWPGMVFHALHNGLAILAGKVRLSPEQFDDSLLLRAIASPQVDGALAYRWSIALMGAAMAVWLLAYLQRLPYQKSAEELLADTIAQRDHRHVPSVAS